MRLAVQPFALDSAQQLDPSTFPNLSRGGSNQVPTTILNTAPLLAAYGIVARYNVTRKKLAITVPGHTGSPDNYDDSVLTQILSLA